MKASTTKKTSTKKPKTQPSKFLLVLCATGLICVLAAGVFLAATDRLTEQAVLLMSGIASAFGGLLVKLGARQEN